MFCDILKFYFSLRIPVNINQLKGNNRKARNSCRIWSKLTIKIPEQQHWRRSNVFMTVLINQFVLPIFCLCFAFTGINFRGMLHHVCDVAYDKNMFGPIKTRKCRSTSWLINYELLFTFEIFHTLFYCLYCSDFKQWKFLFNRISLVEVVTLK